jgi:hypothetical protein
MAFEKLTESLNHKAAEGHGLSEAETRKTAVDRMRLNIRTELPGHPEEYYFDMLERILHTATVNGYSIASVTQSFIAGAKLQGE